MELFIYIFAALFSVLNPLGAVPIFVGLTQDYTKVERSRVSLLTALNVFIILIITSVLVAGGFLAAFLWSVNSGQMDDDYTPSVRILFEDSIKVDQKEELEILPLSK